MDSSFSQFHTCTMELTNACNFKCVHCFEKGQSQARFLTLHDAIRIEKKLRKFDLMRYHLFGGEPLLNPDFLYIYEYLYDLKYQLVITTNLSLLTAEVVGLFMEKKPDLINVSIYGSCKNDYLATTGTDNYDVVVNNLCKLTELNNVFAKIICLNTNSKNKASYSNITSIVKWHHYYVNFVANINGFSDPKEFELSDEDKIELLRSGTNRLIDASSVCSAYKTDFYVYSDGRIGFCPFSVNTDKSILSKYTRIQDMVHKLSKMFLDSYAYPEFCQNCMIKSSCECPVVIRYYNTMQLQKVCEWNRIKLERRKEESV